ncbi:MAG: DUF481 domain-containing protein [Verrucomicrobiales bacterium]|nr:DUF481 domain-containing protein [Verrucomicrobiales bacterium]
MKIRLCPTLQIAIIFTLITAPLIAAAGDPGSPKSPAVDYVQESDWSFEFMPYLWAAGVEGTTSIGNLTSTYTYDFDELISDLDMTTMFVGGFKYKRLGFLTDFQYLKVSPGRPTRGPVFGDVNLTLEQTSLALLGSYDLIAADRFTLSVLGGARYLNVDTTLSVTPGLAGGFSRRSSSQSWDPVGGLRAKYFLNDEWFLSAYGDYGSGDSDETWQAYGGVGYIINENWHASLGYRVLSYSTSGPRMSSTSDTSGIFLGFGYSR